MSCIDVTIMDRPAHTALPSPYAKTLPAFRAGAAFTHAAGLGGKRIIDFIEPRACVSALVPKIEAGQKAPLALEHLDRKFVTVTALNPQKCMSLTLAGLDAGVSREEG